MCKKVNYFHKNGKFYYFNFNVDTYLIDEKYSYNY